jgi:uncharacterized repeat protein (TIGR01451 family)
LLASVSGAAAVNLLHLRSWLGVTDTLTVTAADSRGWRVGPAVFTATLAGDLGAAVPITFAVAAGSPVGATSLATVTATSRISPSIVATATFSIVAAALADVTLDKLAPWQATVGRPLTYTLIVANRGPDGATGVVLTDTLPVSATLLSAASAQGTCSGAATVICNLGTLAAGAATTVTLAVRPIASGALWNTATVTAGELDPDPWDNDDVALTQVWIEERRVYLPLVLRRR